MFQEIAIHEGVAKERVHVITVVGHAKVVREHLVLVAEAKETVEELLLEHERVPQLVVEPHVGERHGVHGKVPRRHLVGLLWFAFVAARGEHVHFEQFVACEDTGWRSRLFLCCATF